MLGNLRNIHSLRTITYTSQSLGPVNASGCAFLSKLGRKLSDQSGYDRETSFLFQRLYVLIQRYNAILLHEVLWRRRRSNDHSSIHFFFAWHNFFIPWELSTGVKTIITTTMFMVLSSWPQSLHEFTRFIWWMQTERRLAANPQTKLTDLGCESAKNWLLPFAVSITIYYYYLAPKLILSLPSL